MGYVKKAADYVRITPTKYAEPKLFHFRIVKNKFWETFLRVNNIKMLIQNFLACKERLTTRGSLKRQTEHKKRSCMEKPCMFCRYGPSVEE